VRVTRGAKPTEATKCCVDEKVQLAFTKFKTSNNNYYANFFFQ